MNCAINIFYVQLGFWYEKYFYFFSLNKAGKKKSSKKISPKKVIYFFLSFFLPIKNEFSQLFNLLDMMKKKKNKNTSRLFKKKINILQMVISLYSLMCLKYNCIWQLALISDTLVFLFHEGKRARGNFFFLLTLLLLLIDHWKEWSRKKRLLK